jgi:hypothetical protein
MNRRLPGLGPDERLLALAPASFRGATMASLWSTFALGAARRRMQTYHAWREYADAAGFTTTGPDIVLGVTDSRLVIFATTFWLSRPRSIVGRVPLMKIGAVATVRHGMVTGLALALTTGEIVEFEALRGRRVRRLATALDEQLDPTNR